MWIIEQYIVKCVIENLCKHILHFKLKIYTVMHLQQYMYGSYARTIKTW